MRKATKHLGNVFILTLLCTCKFFISMKCPSPDAQYKKNENTFLLLNSFARKLSTLERNSIQFFFFSSSSFRGRDLASLQRESETIDAIANTFWTSTCPIVVTGHFR